MIKICFVCLGNICRSPMAMFMMQEKLRKLNLEKDFFITSRATSYEEQGNDMHEGAKKVLQEKHIPFTKHTASKVQSIDYDDYDYFIGMDEYNVKIMKYLFHNDPKEKVSLLLDRNIEDPWYTGDFEKAYNDIERGIDNLLNKLEKKKIFQKER